MDFEALVRGDYVGKRWVLCTEVAAAAPSMVAFLRDNEAADLFLLCGGRGVGEVPDVPTHELGSRGDTIMSGIRAFESAVVDLPEPAQAAVDEFDPDDEAEVLFAGFGTATEIAGRPVFAPRPPEWLDLEDKIAVLEVWDRAGIPTAPHRVVTPNHKDLMTAHCALENGAGTVWVADNREGWHGGGEYLRRIRGNVDIEPTVAFMMANAGHVRVMPFLDGLPCSIHGFVTADSVAVFRPVEMLILWSGNELVYGGVATTWDPAPADRDAMRAMGRAVGEAMRRQVAYRGAFSLDGIMTSAGFLPTEVNPRVSVGLGVQLGDIDDIPLGALTRHLVAHPQAFIDTATLESRIVANADQHRTSRAMLATPTTLEADERRVRLAGSMARDDPNGPIHLSAGPSLHGGIVFIRSEPGVVESGESFAPVVSACVSYVEAWLDIEIGDLTHAVDVRS